VLLLDRFAAVREELPAAVDQLPAAGPEARQLHRRGGGDHHAAARHAREQVSAKLAAARCMCRGDFGTIPLEYLGFLGVVVQGMVF